MEGIRLGRPRTQRTRRVLRLMVLAIHGLLAIASIPANRDVEALSKMGSRGSEVREIQTKLKNWGYYKGMLTAFSARKPGTR